MKDVFVKTKNVKNFLNALSALSQRGSREACLMVVDGKPGLGKTRALNWWACRNDCLCIRAKKEWKPNWFMRDLINAMKKTPEHSFEGMFRQALTELGERSKEAARDGQVFAVVIDEVDYISRSQNLLETIRDLSDFLEIPFILVGMGVIRHNLAKFPQIASRVGQYVDFSPLDLEDTKELVNKLCNVEVEDRLIAFVHAVTMGYVREIKEAIASIDRFASRNPDIHTVTFDMMDGVVLMNDRQNSKPIYVRA
jgi:bacteriophage DNA transposition B protein|nr:MAG TPA: AAA domain protein [Caudoviricetes sp.]